MCRVIELHARSRAFVPRNAGESGGPFRCHWTPVPISLACPVMGLVTQELEGGMLCVSGPCKGGRRRRRILKKGTEFSCNSAQNIMLSKLIELGGLFPGRHVWYGTWSAKEEPFLVPLLEKMLGLSVDFA